MKYIEILNTKIYIIEENLESERGFLFGYWDAKDQTIHLNNTIGKKQKQSTLLHEALHGISDMLGLKLSESQVRGLETALNSSIKIKIKDEDNE